MKNLVVLPRGYSLGLKGIIGYPFCLKVKRSRPTGGWAWGKMVLPAKGNSPVEKTEQRTGGKGTVKRCDRVGEKNGPVKTTRRPGLQ